MLVLRAIPAARSCSARGALIPQAQRQEDPNGGEVVAQEFVARLPNAQLEIIRQAGHAPWIDQLDLCAERTRAFLAA